MAEETFKHFRYEIALGAPIPIPKPKIDYYSGQQYSLQQFLHTLCKENIGSLGKREGKWSFGEDAPKRAALHSRADITQLFDFAEQMGIIEPDSSAAGDFIPYKLSEKYWEKFDKFSS